MTDLHRFFGNRTGDWLRAEQHLVSQQYRREKKKRTLSDFMRKAYASHWCVSGSERWRTGTTWPTAHAGIFIRVISTVVVTIASPQQRLADGIVTLELARTTCSFWNILRQNQCTLKCMCQRLRQATAFEWTTSENDPERCCSGWYLHLIFVKNHHLLGDGLGMWEPDDFYLIWEFSYFCLTEKALFQVILGLLLVYADWEKGGVCLRVCMCMRFMT